MLDSISFVVTTWGGRGYFHFANLHVIEKLTRTGEGILYKVTVEDPDVLVEPWVMASRTLRLTTVAMLD